MKGHKDCGHCLGSGRVAVDHHAWISGGELFEEDIYEDCDECEGHYLGREPHIVRALMSGETRNVFHCAARGCDGCTICKPEIEEKQK